MVDFRTDFEWFRCPKGYRLVHASETARALGEDPESYPDCDWIVPNSDEQIPYRPLERYDTLCNVFAKIQTADDLLRFIEMYGPLTRTSTGWGDFVIERLQSAQYFRGLLQRKSKGPRQLASLFKAQRLAGLSRSYKEAGARLRFEDVSENDFLRLIGTIDIVPDLERGVRIRINFEVLIAALWWQLVQKLSGNAVIRECRHCGTLFEAGVGTNRRSDATFCCSEHSVRFHSLERSRE
jgi:hypothetical protein